MLTFCRNRAAVLRAISDGNKSKLPEQLRVTGGDLKSQSWSTLNPIQATQVKSLHRPEVAPALNPPPVTRRLSFAARTSDSSKLHFTNPIRAHPARRRSFSTAEITVRVENPISDDSQVNNVSYLSTSANERRIAFAAQTIGSDRRLDTQSENAEPSRKKRSRSIVESTVRVIGRTIVSNLGGQKGE
jgi:hypothetical protein